MRLPPTEGQSSVPDMTRKTGVANLESGEGRWRAGTTWTAVLIAGLLLLLALARHDRNLGAR